MGISSKLSKRAIAAAIAFAVLPVSAFAASQVNVDGTEYTEASSGSGSEGGTWSWDGAEDMQLNDFQGSRINAWGDITITLSGENHVDVITTSVNSDTGEAGNLTLIGEGDDAHLTVGTGEIVTRTEYDFITDETYTYADYSGSIYSSGDTTVQNLDLDLEEARLRTDGRLTIEDSEVDGHAFASVIKVEGYNLWRMVPEEEYRPYITIRNSHIHVTSDPSEAGYTIDTSIPNYSWANVAAISVRMAGYRAWEESGNFETEEDLQDYVASYVVPEDMYVLENVEGDITPTLIRFDDKDAYFSFTGADANTFDTLIDPISEPEPETPAEEPAAETAPAAPAPATVLPATADSVAAGQALIAGTGLVLAVVGAGVRRKQD